MAEHNELEFIVHDIFAVIELGSAELIEECVTTRNELLRTQAVEFG